MQAIVEHGAVGGVDEKHVEAFDQKTETHQRYRGANPREIGTLVGGEIAEVGDHGHVPRGDGEQSIPRNGSPAAVAGVPCKLCEMLRVATMTTGRGWGRLAAMVAALGASGVALAGTPPGYTIGARVVATAEPPVSRPDTKPCEVTLFSHEAFDDHGDGSSMAARPHTFAYIPTKACTAAAGKLVLAMDFSVPAGRQFDRTVALWLGGVNLYFGTTIEPEPGVAQHWHVERDLSDYASLFRSAQQGQVVLNNWISPTTNQPIYLDAKLLFYPASATQPAVQSASRVYAMGADPRGMQAELQNGMQELAKTITFPRNVERAYLDVIAQSQAHDERWYTCVDQRYLERTRDYSLESFEACDGGSYRGVQVLVDGKPAGLALVYPWIFTGGIAPHLWLPTPALQTTNFIPARVDLTPFAGLFDDGQPHTIAVRVPGADRFFNVAANLLIYQDAQASKLSGAVTRNTLAASQPAGLTLHDTLHADAAGRMVGTIDTDMAQTGEVAGQLRTPRGVIATSVRYTVGFRNHQTFARPEAERYDETIDQLGTLKLAVERMLDGRVLDGYTVEQRDPLYLSSRKTMHGIGQDFTAEVAMRQGHRIETTRTDAQGKPYHAVLDENLTTRDHADGKTIPDPLDASDFPYAEVGSEQVSFRDSLGSCWRTALQSRDEKLTQVNVGQGCPADKNVLHERSRPDHPWLAPLELW